MTTYYSQQTAPAGAQPGAKNPFAEQPNPFQAAAAPKPSMNELRGGGQVLFSFYI